jgi:hypothetical protein
MLLFPVVRVLDPTNNGSLSVLILDQWERWLRRFFF